MVHLQRLRFQKRSHLLVLRARTLNVSLGTQAVQMCLRPSAQGTGRKALAPDATASAPQGVTPSRLHLCENQVDLLVRRLSCTAKRVLSSCRYLCGKPAEKVGSGVQKCLIFVPWCNWNLSPLLDCRSKRAGSCLFFRYYLPFVNQWIWSIKNFN